MIIVFAAIQILFIALAVAYGLLLFENGLLLFEKSNILTRIVKKKRLAHQGKTEEKARANVPVHQQVDPVVAYKRAYVLETGELAGIGFMDRYRPYDVAVCRYGEDHVVPSISCSCGFWGLPDPAATAKIGGGVPYLGLLQVEFFGEVLRMEKGYRARTQRILSIQFKPDCIGCFANRADKLLTIKLFGEPDSEWILRDSGLGGLSNLVAKSIGHDSPYIQFCSTCIAKFMDFPNRDALKGVLEIQDWSLSEVANRFQVEVNWIAQDLFNSLFIGNITYGFKPQITIYCEQPQELLLSITKG